MTRKLTREPITHELKIYPEFFSAVCTGDKRAELRKNDRDYRVGDTLHLLETPRGSCHSTGEFINATVTHIADVGEWMPGYVLLSIEREAMDRKAAMDSEPVAVVEPSDYVTAAQLVGEESLRKAVRELYEGALRIGDKLYRHAQPAPVVPDIDELRLAFEATERESDDGFNLHKSGIGYADDATQGRWESWLACRDAMLAAAPQPQNAPQNIPEIIPDCWCRTCRPVVLNDMRFVVCPDCGNKRCPRANDHRNACTGSNEPGQEGSAYPAAPQSPGSEPATLPGKWIPVSERLPLTPSADCEYSDIEVNVFDGERVFTAHYATGSQPNPCGYWVDTYAKITHWQPLPAAPQEDKP